jgi:hydroxyacylglutathione hydrolase
MPEINIYPIPAFQDNYIWCLSKQGQCVVVDPGDAQPVLEHCTKQGLILSDILITHHHWDHTNGVAQLLEHFPKVKVYGPEYGTIKNLSHKLNEGDKIQLSSLACEFDILYVPGHTLDHIAYYGAAGLFCGDTLFSAGCGRLFEGTAEQMYQSLQKLSKLPAQTAVYCTHEYTLANLAFALKVEPDNADLLDYRQWAEQQRSQGKPTLPSAIGQQLAINPFLRSNVKDVIVTAQQHGGEPLSNPVAVFTELRRWKDNF